MELVNNILNEKGKQVICSQGSHKFCNMDCVHFVPVRLNSNGNEGRIYAVKILCGTERLIELDKAENKSEDKSENKGENNGKD